MYLIKYAKKAEFNMSSKEELRRISIKLKKILKEDELNDILNIERKKSLMKIDNEIQQKMEIELTKKNFQNICKMIRIHEIRFSDLKGVRF